MGEESMADLPLQAQLIAYLESKGWYFDWPHILDVWGTGKDSLANKDDAIRSLNGWTVPQWGEYWQKPYADDPKHANYGAPKTRRYENMQEAVWSQLLREERPDQFGVFFDDKEES